MPILCGLRLTVGRCRPRPASRSPASSRSGTTPSASRSRMVTTAGFSRWPISPTSRLRARALTFRKDDDDGRNSQRHIGGPVRCAGDRRRHGRADGRDPRAQEGPDGQRHPAREGEREAFGRHLDGHGRTQQHRHTGLRHAGAVHQGNHHRQRRHRRSGGGLQVRAELLRDHSGARSVRHPLPEEPERRFRRQEGAPHRHLRAADAERRHRQEGALSPAPAASAC